MLFSWNLQGKPELLERALKFLAAQPSAVGAFQEVPGSLTSGTLARIGVAHSLIVHTQHNDRWHKRNLAIVSTVGLKSARGRADPDGMFAAVSITIPGLGLVDVVVVHAISKLTENNERQRIKRAARLRRSLNALWFAPKLIVLGDFNAEPFDVEIWDEDAFNAVRDRHLIHSHPSDDPDFRSRSLLNLSWCWLSESPSRGAPGGTYRYDRVSRHSSWYSFDQIMVSEPLIDYAGGYSVRSDIGGKLLAQDPIKGHTITLGDHLPASAVLRPERWNQL